MRSRPDFAPPVPPPVPRVPAWARPGNATSDVDAGYVAGAALNALDQLVRSAPVWAGVWRHRMALGAAAAAIRVRGRTEDEADLRDAFLFRSSGDDPGPAGKVLLAWRKQASRSTAFDGDAVQSVADLLEVKWDGALAGAVARVDDLAAAPKAAPVAAAELAADLCRARPDAELLAFWLADAMLARKFRWAVPVPLLMGQVASSTFRAGEPRKRILPGNEGWGRAVLLAYARAAAEACDLGADLATRSLRLANVAPKLRAKGAAEVVKLLLEEDALPASWSSATLSTRGARRLFERLHDLGAVRELTGRPTFRLYGL